MPPGWVPSVLSGAGSWSVFRSEGGPPPHLFVLGVLGGGVHERDPECSCVTPPAPARPGGASWDGSYGADLSVGPAGPGAWMAEEHRRREQDIRERFDAGYVNGGHRGRSRGRSRGRKRWDVAARVRVV